jgi:DNA polymerase phi
MDEDEDDAGSASADEDESDDVAEDDDDDMAPVDPAFRQRVADALQGALMDIDGDDKDSDDESDEEVWDDEQMMQVDEQLAEVFRQQAGSTTKRSDLKRE